MSTSAHGLSVESSRLYMPIPATIGVEKDRGTRPVDFLATIYFLLKEKWIGPRPIIQEVDSDISHMLQFMAAESTELLEELEGNTFDLEAYIKEAVDVLVIANSLAMNNDIVPNFAQIARVANGQAPNETVFLSQIETLANLENLEELENPEALKAHVDKALITIFSFIHHGPALPSPDYILNGTDMVIEKITRNYDEMYYQDIHWQTGQKLTREQQFASNTHSNKCLRLIRNHTGNKPHGLDRHDHYPYRFYIFDFENSDKAYAELKQKLASDLITPTVIPSYMDESLLLSYFGQEQAHV
jgi:NTP pyrophosphatase (non-canonical NTP hydrolase)